VISTAPPVTAVTIGTRGSPLARAQTRAVVEALQGAWEDVQVDMRAIETRGDRTQATGEPLPEIGGKGLFTAELEQALRDGEIELAVHSLKDLPTEQPEGIAIGAVCLREDARDCAVVRDGLTLGGLPPGASVGTSSLRRSAQLRVQHPQLEARSIRGNVDTRVQAVREGRFDAVLLAAAGVRRLGLAAEVSEWLDEREIVPAPGQGALAVQCRAGDDAVLTLLAAIADPAARAATDAERAFLRALDAGCTAPVGAHARSLDAADRASATLEHGEGHVRMNGLVASVDGRTVVRVSGEGEPFELGERLAREALAAGADRILEELRG
jgi:hydroxymethylbilane synthase